MAFAAGVMPSDLPIYALEPTPSADGDHAQTSNPHLIQLRNCKAGITDAHGRQTDRQRWVETLFAFDTPEADTLIVELLGPNVLDDARQSVCDSIATLARSNPTRLRPAFVDPLVELLGADTDALRSASAKALADFPGVDVPKKLGALASNPEVPLIKRLAAVDVLALRVDQKEVIEQLIRLLETDEPALAKHVANALAPASRKPLGDNVSSWHQWWNEKSRLGHNGWLTDRLAMYRERLRAIQQDDLAIHQQLSQRLSAVSNQLTEFQRQVFLTLPADQKDPQLATWLGSELPEVQLAAAALIKARIADEGIRPTGNLLAALLKLLDDDSPRIRREILLIVQTMPDETVIRKVLSRLELEQDIPTRYATLKAIGRLDSPQAAPVLIQEIANIHSAPICVKEAATALGRIGPKIIDAKLRTQATEALKTRYAPLSNHTNQTPPPHTDLRAALLAAMAGLGDKAFGPEFVEAVESDDPNVLRAAIRGLQTVGDRSKLPRLRTLAAAPNPLVRLASVTALGILGSEDADIERLLTQLTPANENDQLVREASWRAFQAILQAKTIEQRFALSARLRDLPEREAMYLQSLSEEIATSGNHEAIDQINDRLGILLVSLGRYDDASAILKRLYEWRATINSEEGFAVGLQWLDATLHASASVDLAIVVNALATTASSENQKQQVSQAIEKWFESQDALDNPDRARAKLESLATISDMAMGKTWQPLLTRLRLATASPTEDSQSSGSNN